MLRRCGMRRRGIRIINNSNMSEIVQLNSKMKLSEHFTLGELTKSGSHPEVYNIPSHEVIANLKRVCGWLEVLRKRYNDKYNACHLEHHPSVMSSVVETSLEISPCASLSRDDTGAVVIPSVPPPVIPSVPPLSSRPSAARGEIS